MAVQRNRVRWAAFGGVLAVAVTVAVGCIAGDRSPAESSVTPDEVRSRLDAIALAVEGWRGADDLTTARRHAEAARNLVVGPDGPQYGDRDGDGTIEGASGVGLLPGQDGERGLAQPPATPCVHSDVLGGSWDDPEARWAEFSAVLADWAPGANTMPQLASHPHRVAGWATLTLDADSLDAAHEYAGHAQLHVDITRAAYVHCPD